MTTPPSPPSSFQSQSSPTPRFRSSPLTTNAAGRQKPMPPIFCRNTPRTYATVNFDELQAQRERERSVSPDRSRTARENIAVRFRGRREEGQRDVEREKRKVSPPPPLGQEGNEVEGEKVDADGDMTMESDTVDAALQRGIEFLVDATASSRLVVRWNPNATYILVTDESLPALKDTIRFELSKCGVILNVAVLAGFDVTGANGLVDNGIKSTRQEEGRTRDSRDGWWSLWKDLRSCYGVNVGELAQRMGWQDENLMMIDWE